MADEFHAVITELWTKLKLGVPVFGQGQAVTMTVDGVDVSLAESADGNHVVVSGIAGRLPAQAYQREEQVRRLLRTNLGLLQSNCSGLLLEGSEDTAAVRVQAVYAYTQRRIDTLIQCIEDVLDRLEMHAGDLGGAAAHASSAAVRAVDPAPLDTLIFRP